MSLPPSRPYSTPSRPCPLVPLPSPAPPSTDCHVRHGPCTGEAISRLRDSVMSPRVPVTSLHVPVTFPHVPVTSLHVPVTSPSRPSQGLDAAGVLLRDGPLQVRACARVFVCVCARGCSRANACAFARAFCLRARAHQACGARAHARARARMRAGARLRLRCRAASRPLQQGVPAFARARGRRTTAHGCGRTPWLVKTCVNRH